MYFGHALFLEGQRRMRLELSSEGRYALRALIYLARVNRRVTADTISADTGIPRRLLARVLAKLSRARLVRSSEGRGGGSELARSPEQITLREAVEAIEGPFEVTRCIMEERACGTGAPCAMHEAWEEGQEAILDYLQGQTLSEFVSQTAAAVRPEG
ncbi:transcriptional regulator, BadM/Rrf2 family [Rubrobacter xylanophilus DSM 9941]|uniref:Transcriptional regulator, BadM/Rrf2 family n=2 Tax=Rubrobacter xylanophilus TaxID=49319 RepID=Q1ASU3_RUBXD|nr:transcriptional regulator, BadM/Rrf2 family [Rubrobacter xylanophilus DSM 9941]